MNRKIVLLFCLFGFIVRSTYIIFFNPDISFPDEERFWGEGLHLVNKLTLQTTGGKYAHDMPITGLFIATTSVLTGGSVIGVKLFFALISSLTIYVISLIAYEMYPSNKTTILAAFIASVYPFFIFYSSLLLSETLFLFIVSLFFFLLLRINKSSGWQIGVVAGLVHLTRPTLLYFMPVVWGWQYLIRKFPLKTVALGAVLFVGMVSVWGVRNVVVLDQFHLTTTGAGQVLWEGNNPWNKTGGVSGSFSDPEVYLSALPEGLSELEADNWKKERAIQYISENPVHFLELAGLKFSRFWHLWPNSLEHQSWKYKVISLCSFGVVLLFSILAVFVFYHDYKRLSLIYAFVGYYTLIHMVTIGSIRYRLPLEPLLIALSSAAIAKLLAGYWESRESRNAIE